MEFEEGQEVRIIKHGCGHGFNIGEIVIIKEVDIKADNYNATNGTVSFWIEEHIAEAIT